MLGVDTDGMWVKKFDLRTQKEENIEQCACVLNTWHIVDHIRPWKDNGGRKNFLRSILRSLNGNVSL